MASSSTEDAMKVDMLAKGFLITPSLQAYLDRRLRFSLSPVKSKIQGIAVWLRDLNGPRGGRDKQCQVSITISGCPTVLVKEVQENMYCAIDRAVKRAAYRAVQILMRQRMAVRQTAKSIVAARNRSLAPDFATEGNRLAQTIAPQNGWPRV
jgi:ribosome-associated translation inhibitor RaiA